MWRVAERTACRQWPFLCVMILATSFLCISCFPWCLVLPSPAFRDVPSLYLAFPVMFRPCVSRFPWCYVPVSCVSRDVPSLYLAFSVMLVPVSRVSRDFPSLYLAFPALFRPVSRVSRDVPSLYLAFLVMFFSCISRFSCSVPVSRVSLFSLFPVLVITVYPQSARSQPINIARLPQCFVPSLAAVLDVPEGRSLVRLKLNKSTYQTCHDHV